MKAMQAIEFREEKSVAARSHWPQCTKVIERNFFCFTSWKLQSQPHWQQQVSTTPSISNEAPAYRPTDDEWESGAAIGFATSVCLDMFFPESSR